MDGSSQCQNQNGGKGGVEFTGGGLHGSLGGSFGDLTVFVRVTKTPQNTHTHKLIFHGILGAILVVFSFACKE